MGEELSRVEDLLATGVEEPVEPMSRVEAILRGEDIKPLSRVENLLKDYNPPDYDYIDLNVTENGTYTPPSGKMYKKAVVDVPSQEPVLGGISIYSNGTYTPDPGVDGFDNVLVAVPATQLDNLSVTENGTYTPISGHGFNEVTVDVAGSGGLKTIEHESIATFADGTDNFLKSLEVAIEPVQSGSGDPSPSNVRPISGHTEANVTDDSVYGGNVNWNQIVNRFNTPSGTIQGIKRIFVTDGEKRGVKISGTATVTDSYTVAFIDNPPPHKYFVTLGNVTLPTGCALNGKYDKATSIISKDGRVAQIFIRIDANTSIDATVYPQIVDLTQLFGETKADEIYAMEQAEEGSGVAYFKSLFYKDYYPYNSGEITNVSAVNGDTDKYRTYNIQFRDGDNPLTVYGGSLDVVSGELKVVPYYDSYNGETLEGEWISDRDVYAVGTTPTIGAQVVNIGATPLTYQLTPTIIKSLQGENNIFASTGEIELLQYWSTDADPILSDLNVDSNGEYTPAAGHGFRKVTVDVAGVGGLEEVDLYLDEYEELTPQQKSDTTKIYFVTDEEES